MITVKSESDLKKIPTNHPTYSIIATLWKHLSAAYCQPGKAFDWKAYGYIKVATEERDADLILSEISDDFFEFPITMLEAVSKENNFYIAILLLNNDAAFEYVIDADLCNNHPLKEALDYHIT